MRIADPSTPVVVLRLDHYGALGVMRSLGRLGVDVYGVHHDARAPAFRSRYCRGGLVWDLDAEPPARSVARLLQLAAGFGRRAILVPTNDETALFVAEHAAALRTGYLFQDNSAALVRTLYDKRSLHRLARRLGVATPETVVPMRRADVVDFCRSARFPVMLKGGDGIALARRTGLKMVIARSAAELLSYYDRMEDGRRPDLMLQEYIPGGEDSQWMFNGCFDARSECVFGATGRKLRQTPPYTGMTSLGVCLRNEVVEQATRELVKAVGYRGILDIGFRFDGRDGSYKLLDANPRLGATFRLFVGEDGMDVARALYLDLTGRPVPPSRVREGRRWLVEDLDVASSVRYWRDGALRPGDWAGSLVGVRETAWYARDDLAPLRAVGGRLACAVARRAARRVGVAPAPRARTRTAHDELVRAHFAAAARGWQHVYQEERLVPLIYRERHQLTLRWIEEIALPRGARVLEIGCGPGHTAVALARLGYRVHAIDAAPEMIALTRRAARQAGLVELTAEVGDAQALELPEGAFDLVLALGVLPWLRSDREGILEMARVVRPGGHLIASVDNRLRLSRLLDPRSTPALAPARAALKRALAPVRGPDPDLVVRTHDAVAVDRLVRAAGLHRLRVASLGFGPFVLFGRRVLPEAAGMRLHRALQRLADQGWPILRSTGDQVVFLAGKP